MTNNINPFTVLDSGTLTYTSQIFYYTVYKYNMLSSGDVGNSSNENLYILISYRNCGTLSFRYSINYADGAYATKTYFKSYFVINSNSYNSILISLNDISFDNIVTTQEGGLINYVIHIETVLESSSNSAFKYPSSINYKILSISNYLNSIFN